MEMNENRCPREAQGRMCKGKGTNSFEQLVCTIHIPSYFKNYLGWNHSEENIEIGLKNWISTQISETQKPKLAFTTVSWWHPINSILASRHFWFLSPCCRGYL